MAVRRKFTQTKFFSALVVFGILIFFIFFQPRFIISPIRFVVAAVTWPFERILSAFAFEIRDKFQFVASIGELKKENDHLSKENIRLAAENASLQNISKDDDELRRELDLLPREEYHLLSASIIGRDVAGMGNWLTIDQGTLQGVAPNMPVVVGQSVLIGKVSEVFPQSARIMLLSNPESFVNGITTDTQTRGIVKGEHGLGLLFDMVLQSDGLTAGASVVTSGLGGDLPKNLLIGTLEEVRLSEDRLYRRATVVSPVDFDVLRYVFIIQNPSKP